MGKNLENSVAIITGASSGIGREAAILFAREDVKVVLASRREDKLRDVAKEIGGSDVLVVPTDVADPKQVEHLVKATMDKFGRIDILVNNAGFGEFAGIEETTLEDMRGIFDVNLMGAFCAAKAVLPHMRKQGSGHIINISSIAGKRGLPLHGAYCATKAAMNAIFEALRVELAGTGIHVSLVYPITTTTEFFDVLKNRREKKFEPPKIFTQSAFQVAEDIVDCARNPKPEVHPFPLARFMILLNAVAPGVLDFILRRYYKSIIK